MRIGTGLAGFLAAVLVAGCGAGPAADPAPTSSAPSTPPSSAPPPASPARTPAPTGRPADRPVVVLVSVDGLNPDVLDETALPAFGRLAAEGASTRNARTLVEATETLPNHTAMLTGRPLDGFSVDFNEDNGSTLERVHGAYVPGVFDVAHDRDVATAFLAEKDKLGFLVRSWDATHGAPDRVGDDNGTDKVDLDALAGADELLARALHALAGGVRLVFLHIKGPDVAGHEHGWLSGAYVEAVRAADREVGALLEAVAADADLRRRTTVLLTADHGGAAGARRHSEGGPADYRIPFYAWGRGVRRGADLYALNDDRRRDPGTTQPSYDGVQPIRNLDAANLALGLLGLPALDDGLDTRPLLLR